MADRKNDSEIIIELLKVQGRHLDDLSNQMQDMRYEQRDQGQRLRRLENSMDSIRMTWSSRLVAGILGTSAITSAAVAYFISSIV